MGLCEYEEECDRMTLRKFLREETLVGELCVVREDGWRTGAAWIDNEDLFMYNVSTRILDKSVKADEWGTLEIVDQVEEEHSVPCHYIDV